MPTSPLEAVLIGTVGTSVGFGLSSLKDFITTRQRQQREDRVWRRERFVDAAARLLALSWDLYGADEAVIRAVYSLGNAERANPSYVPQASKLLAAAHAEYRPLPQQARACVETLRLYAPTDVYEAGLALTRPATENVSAEDTHKSAERWQAANLAADHFATVVRRAAGTAQ